MTNTKRGRGRPPGPSAADRGVLEAVADIMLAEPGLKRATAMKRIVADDPAILRRLHRHWNVLSTELQEGAQRRAAAKAARSSQEGPRAGTSRYRRGRVTDGFAPLATRDLENTAWFKALKAVEESPTLKLLKALEESPTMKLLREMEESPAMKLLKAKIDPPGMKEFRERQETIARLVRGLD